MVDDDHHRQPFIVGFALKAEKASKHVSQHLIDHAAEHGIQIKIICIDRPLEDQGPFNAILQKIRRRGMYVCACVREERYRCSFVSTEAGVEEKPTTIIIFPFF